MAKKRGNNEGTIIRRKDGHWMAQVTLGRDPQTGKLKRATFYGKTRQAAAEQLAKALRERQQGLFVAPHKRTVGEWLDTWLEEYKKPKLRPTSYDSYAMLIRRHLKPALGHLALQELRPEHVQHFYNTRMHTGAAATSIWLCHAVLSGALAVAEKHQLVGRNVCKLIEVPRADRKAMRTLTLEQFTGVLLPALTPHRLFAAIFLAFGTGLRRGELLALRWQDVDLSGGVLHVRRTLVRVSTHQIHPGERRTQLVFQDPKPPSSWRTIPIPAACLTALRQHKAQQAQDKLLLGQAYEDNGLIFCQPDGTPIDPRNFLRTFTQVVAQAGLPPIRFHDARHTFATLMLELGESPKTVQTMLGHSRVAMTLDIYSHVSLELETRAAARLNAALTGGH